MLEYFNVVWRNVGHWDISTKQGRYKIRGGTSDHPNEKEFYVIDETGTKGEILAGGFGSDICAMNYLTGRLM